DVESLQLLTFITSPDPVGFGIPPGLSKLKIQAAAQSGCLSSTLLIVSRSLRSYRTPRKSKAP
ncbi:hypothetical protein STEG23_004464, partial [Scotinomys teguina]